MLQRIEDSLRDRATEARRRATPLRRVLGARSEHALVRHLIVESPDGALLAVQEGGRRDGPALLLLPGQANSYRWWTGLRETSNEPTGRSPSTIAERARRWLRSRTGRRRPSPKTRPGCSGPWRSLEQTSTPRPWAGGSPRCSLSDPLIWYADWCWRRVPRPGLGRDPTLPTGLARAVCAHWRGTAIRVLQQLIRNTHVGWLRCASGTTRFMVHASRQCHPCTGRPGRARKPDSNVSRPRHGSPRIATRAAYACDPDKPRKDASWLPWPTWVHPSG